MIKVTDITDIELLELKKGPPLGLRPTLAWIKAFEFFNQNHIEHRPLQMSCRPCFHKVYQYLLEKKSTTKNV